jgi:hypothetical protein
LTQEWKLSVLLLDIIFLIANKDFEFAETKLKDLKRSFRLQLNQPKFEKENLLIQLMNKWIKLALQRKKSDATDLMEAFIKKYKTIEPGSNEAIDYTLFLKSELQKTSYYELLLEEINKR